MDGLSNRWTDGRTDGCAISITFFANLSSPATLTLSKISSTTKIQYLGLKSVTVASSFHSAFPRCHCRHGAKFLLPKVIQ